MTAIIYQPGKTAMSSGQAKTKDWVLEYPPSSNREIDPLMGWTSSEDTQSQVRIKFQTKEEAISYAKELNLEYSIRDPQKRKVNIRPNGYADNFAWNRKSPWTH